MLNDQQIIDAAMIKPIDLAALQPHSYDATLSAEIKVAAYNWFTRKAKWVTKRIPRGGSIILKPKQFALASTVEYFRLPQTVVGFVQGKSTIGRNGLQIENAGLIDAGFEGAITLELYNMAPWPIELRYGMRICQMHFTKVDQAEFTNYALTGHYNKQTGPTEPIYDIK